MKCLLLKLGHAFQELDKNILHKYILFPIFSNRIDCKDIWCLYHDFIVHCALGKNIHKYALKITKKMVLQSENTPFY